MSSERKRSESSCQFAFSIAVFNKLSKFGAIFSHIAYKNRHRKSCFGKPAFILLLRHASCFFFSLSYLSLCCYYIFFVFSPYYYVRRNFLRRNSSHSVLMCIKTHFPLTCGRIVNYDVFFLLHSKSSSEEEGKVHKCGVYNLIKDLEEKLRTTILLSGNRRDRIFLTGHKRANVILNGNDNGFSFFCMCWEMRKITMGRMCVTTMGTRKGEKKVSLFL